jgi:hypothetical protein
MKDFDLAEASLELLGQLPRNVIPSVTPSGSPGSVRPDGELSNNHNERSTPSGSCGSVTR